MTVEIDFVRQLAEVLSAARLTKIDVSHGNRRIRIARKSQRLAGASATFAVVQPLPAALLGSDLIADPLSERSTLIVRSPHVGRAYLSGEIGVEPFASVGRAVAAGDTLLLVEMMNVKMPILAPAPGVVVAVLVDDGGPVEFDQSLIALE